MSSPSHVEQLPVPQVHPHRFPERAARLHLIRPLGIIARQPGLRLVARHRQHGRHFPPFHRLQQQHDGQSQHHAVGQAAGERQHHPDEGVHHQYLAREEGGVEMPDDQQQGQPPQEAQAEVASALPLVVILDEEAEAE